ncbi:phage major capsid protein [Dehalobacterium formicoaceticum]|uniref:phage major capsid protein n=1 Tax=Dehalobacterium formicoaceticum TaxID=51515 RepID=UPI0012F81883|nr:phage major capsid protein [Dehalobacterium formicoaceticum]
MALKQLILNKRMSDLKSQLEILRAKDADFATRKAALEVRETELEVAVNEITEETPEEDKAVVDESVAAFEADQEALGTEQAENEVAKKKLEDEIQTLQKELDEIDSRAKTLSAKTEEQEERKGDKRMTTRINFYGMNHAERDAFFARDDVRNFIDEVRAIKTRGISNGGLTVPDDMLEILRNNMEQYSKLIKYVNVKSVGGIARQNIMGAAPEGIWMEAEGELNELDMTLNQIEVDGYMVGGIIWVHNNLLKDSDIALGSEIMDQLGKAIGKGVDRGVLFGTGVKMPLGIVTRLAQTSAPSDWGTYAPAWTDLHSTNIKKLNINGATGAGFYADLIAALGIASPAYSDGRVFWVMNRKTHINIMTKALAFDAGAALVAGVSSQMPILGGTIEELEIVGDNEIIGGFGSLYLLAEREGSAVESSEHARFVKNQTGFKGYARYDGMPVFGEAFVMVSFDETDAATSSTFHVDYANVDIGTLAVTSAASATKSGDTIITVAGKESSGTTLAYKVAGKAISVSNGSKLVGFTAWDGDDEITAATGTIITVVELNDDNRAIKVGSCSVVAKA